jgi:predicted tellurium resistance membrane protein TerC
MVDLLVDPKVWIGLFSVTFVQIALGADNLIIITIIANKLPVSQRKKAINLGLLLAMVFRLFLLFIVSYILKYVTGVFYQVDTHYPPWLSLHAELSGKVMVLFFGGLFLIWKGIKELRLKAKGLEHELEEADRFAQVVVLIVGMNLLFSVDSILTVVGMTDVFFVMMGSVMISVGLMLLFVGYISEYITKNPDFEILGLFVLLLIGFVLFLEGGHVAHLTVNGNTFPYIPQWIVIFILLLMFSVDLYQNWLERKRDKDPLHLRRRKKVSVVGG